MVIHGFQKTTLLDYPKHLAAVIFLGGCNFICPFCHNASLVLDHANQPVIPEDEVFEVLMKRKHLLEGICITGGEPTLYPDLPALIEKIKSLGLDVKLDTNGTNPSMLQDLIDRKLIDYAAMDIKNSPCKYAATIGLADQPERAEKLLSETRKSVSILMDSKIDYEFRTTAVKEFHTAEDFREIGKWLAGAASYYIQSFKDSGNIISPGLHAYDQQELEKFADIIRPSIASVFLRGID